MGWLQRKRAKRAGHNPDDPPNLSKEELSRRLPLQFIIFYLDRTDHQYKACWGLLLYFPFLIFLTWSMVVNRGFEGPGYGMRFALADIGELGEWNQGPDDGTASGGGGLYFMKAWGDIGEFGDLERWFFADEAFQTLLGQDENTVAGLNRIVTPIRIGQWRSKQSGCENLKEFTDGPLPEGKYAPCYRTTSKNAEQKTPMRDDVNICGKDFPLGDYGFTGFRRYHTQKDIEIIEEFPGVNPSPSSPPSIEGWRTYYDTTALYAFDVWATDIDDSLKEIGQPAFGSLTTNDKITCMFEQGWVDAGTRAVYVSFFVYNPAHDLFTQVQLLLETPTSGRYTPWARFITFRYARFKGFGFIFRELFLMVYTLFLLVTTLVELYRHWKRQTLKTSILKNGWWWLRMVLLGLLFYNAIFKITFWIIDEFKFEPDNDMPRLFEALPEDSQDFWLQEALFEQLNNYAAKARELDHLNAFLILIAYLKIFEYWSVSPHFNLLTLTLTESAGPLAALCLAFFVLIAGFTVSAMLLYATTLEDFGSVFRTLVTIVRLALGDFDYPGMQNLSAPVTAAFFLIFTLIIWLFILNLFIGVISEGFVSAKEKRERSIITVKSWLRQKTFMAHAMGLPIVKRFISIPGKKKPSPIIHNSIDGVALNDVIQVLQTLKEKARKPPAIAGLGDMDTLFMDAVAPDPGEFASPEELRDHVERYDCPDARPELITVSVEEFALAWQIHTAVVNHKQKGFSIGLKLWELFGTTRESIHTWGRLYEDEIGDEYKEVAKVPEPLPTFNPDEASPDWILTASVKRIRWSETPVSNGPLIILFYLGEFEDFNPVEFLEQAASGGMQPLGTFGRTMLNTEVHTLAPPNSAADDDLPPYANGTGQGGASTTLAMEPASGESAGTMSGTVSNDPPRMKNQGARFFPDPNTGRNETGDIQLRWRRRKNATIEDLLLFFYDGSIQTHFDAATLPLCWARLDLRHAGTPSWPGMKKPMLFHVNLVPPQRPGEPVAPNTVLPKIGEAVLQITYKFAPEKDAEAMRMEEMAEMLGKLFGPMFNLSSSQMEKFAKNQKPGGDTPAQVDYAPYFQKMADDIKMDFQTQDQRVSEMLDKKLGLALDSNDQKFSQFENQFAQQEQHLREVNNTHNDLRSALLQEVNQIPQQTINMINQNNEGLLKQMHDLKSEIAGIKNDLGDKIETQGTVNQEVSRNLHMETVQQGALEKRKLEDRERNVREEVHHQVHRYMSEFMKQNQQTQNANTANVLKQNEELLQQTQTSIMESMQHMMTRQFAVFNSKLADLEDRIHQAQSPPLPKPYPSGTVLNVQPSPPFAMDGGVGGGGGGGGNGPRHLADLITEHMQASRHQQAPSVIGTAFNAQPASTPPSTAIHTPGQSSDSVLLPYYQH